MNLNRKPNTAYIVKCTNNVLYNSWKKNEASKVKIWSANKQTLRHFCVTACTFILVNICDLKV